MENGGAGSASSRPFYLTHSVEGRLLGHAGVTGGLDQLAEGLNPEGPFCEGVDDANGCHDLRMLLGGQGAVVPSFDNGAEIIQGLEG